MTTFMPDSAGKNGIGKSIDPDSSWRGKFSHCSSIGMLIHS